MLMAVKNQFKVMNLSIKYALMREMLNKTSFIMNIVFMILNNATFIIQWIIIYSLKDNIGGYSIKQVFLLWGIASFTFGVSHFFFKKSFKLSDIINDGKLDSFLVQPKNVLISAITTDVEPSAIGDMIYGYIMLFFYGINLRNFILFTFLGIMGGLIITSVAVILGSLSFWLNKSDVIADTGNSLLNSFGTYPDGIFKGISKIILYTIVPAGIINYMPVRIICNFNIFSFLIVIGVTILFILLSFVIFYKGLRRYSGTNLMIAKI